MGVIALLLLLVLPILLILTATGNETTVSWLAWAQHWAGDTISLFKKNHKSYIDLPYNSVKLYCPQIF